MSRASRQALTSDSCKSPNTQWKMPSEEKRDGKTGEVKRKKERGKRREEKGKELREKKGGS